MSRILKRIRKAAKRKWFRQRGKTFQVPADARLVERVEELKRDVRKLCGVKLTATYIFREGASQFIKSLRKQMTRADKGKLHAARTRKGLV